MADWVVSIAETCQYNHETVEIAMSCLDRFLMVDSNVLHDRNQFQLAVMTALYTSVKIHEREAIDPLLLSQLSGGAHSPQHIEAMERRMCSSLSWLLNPPTALSFARTILDSVRDADISNKEKLVLLELVEEQLKAIRYATSYKFASSYNPSSVAFAALLNAIETCVDCGASSSYGEVFVTKFRSSVESILFHNDYDINKAIEVERIQTEIYKRMNSRNGNNNDDAAMDKDSDSDSISSGDELTSSAKSLEDNLCGSIHSHQSPTSVTRRSSAAQAA
jgi:hypothetical protein